MSGAGRKSGGAGVAENDGAGAETERGAGESAAHGLLTVGRERGGSFC